MRCFLACPFMDKKVLKKDSNLRKATVLSVFLLKALIDLTNGRKEPLL